MSKTPEEMEQQLLWEFFHDALHYGLVKYTCDKQPRIKYINQNMKDLLRFPKEESVDGYLENAPDTIFALIPFEERRRFSMFLNRVYSSDTPVAGEMTMLRCDGTRVHVFGWVTKALDEEGNPEFRSICIDTTERYERRKNAETRRYLKALSEVYDLIFEFNFKNTTVKCLHCEEGSSFRNFQNVAMQMGEAVESWLLNSVSSEQQDRVRQFFKGARDMLQQNGEDRLPQITYEARNTRGEICGYQGVFIRVEEGICFYCCRQIKDPEETLRLKNENDQLRDGLRDLVMQFQDGLAAFEVNPRGEVRPLYASENVYSFFGYSRQEWIPLTRQFTPLREFTRFCETKPEAFEMLLQKGEARFTYFDHETGRERGIRAICSRKEADGKNTRFVMLYAQDEPEPDSREDVDHAGQTDQTDHGEHAVRIRTFGYFDVFVGDQPIAFRNQKSKELLALLVDRRGGYVTSEEAISFLWEDEPVTPMVLSRYRKVAMRLKNTLEEYGIPQIIESAGGKRRLVTGRVQCDLEQYLSGEEKYAQLFRGSYLTNYSWAETTLGELMTDFDRL